MDKLVFLAHPVDLNSAYTLLGYWGSLASRIPKGVFKKILKSLPPYRFFYIDHFKSQTGREISGYAIVCPLLPEQMVGQEKAGAIRKIIAACNFAERLGAKIVGLGGFTSIISDQGLEVGNNSGIAITSGNTYTASITIEGLLKSANLMGFELKNTTVSIIGATGNIGSICTRVLSKKVGRLILVSRNQKKLREFVKNVKQKSFSKIEIFKQPHEAASQSDIILTATSAITTLIRPQDINPGSIICDVSVPSNIAREIISIRDDVLVFEGGFVQIPYPQQVANKKWYSLFKDGVIFGCLAETMILTLEKRFEDYSFGRNEITEDKIKEIYQMGLKHGFKLANFFYGDKRFSDKDLEKIRESRKKKND